MGFMGPKSSRYRADAGDLPVAFGLPGEGGRRDPPDVAPIDKRYLMPDPKFQQPITAHTTVRTVEYGRQLVTRTATGENTTRQGAFVVVRRGNVLRIMRQPSGDIFSQVGRIPLV